MPHSTGAEVGYAYAKGKPIFFYEPLAIEEEQQADFWFVREMAGVRGRAVDARAAWGLFVGEVERVGR